MDDTKAISLDEQTSTVRRAFDEMQRAAMPISSEPCCLPYWVVEVYPDYIIVCENIGDYWRIGYTMSAEGVQFAVKDTWSKVEKDWIEAKGLNTEPMTYIGDAVKSLSNGKVGGYLVRFSSADDPDLAGDFFTSDTDFDLDFDENGYAKSTTYWNHGLDPALKKRTLQATTLKKDEFGIWAETILQESDQYENFILGLSQKGRIRYSSGVPGHLVERQPVGKAFFVKRWPLGKDASLTHTPAEPRNFVLPLKSLPISDLEPESEPEASAEGGQPPADAVEPTGERNVVITVTASEGTGQILAELANKLQSNGENNMSENNEQGTQTPPANVAPENEAATKAEVKALSDQIGQILKYMQDTPAISGGGYLSHTGGGSDQQVKSLGDFLLSVINGDDVRLGKVYGSYKAINTQTGQEGGYAVPTDYSQRFLQAAAVVSPILARVERIPVGTVAGEYPFLDMYATPEAGQSAASAKVKATKRAETGNYTATEPEFVMLEFKVNSQGGYIPVSRRASRAIPMLENLIVTLIGNTQAHKYEYLVLNGTGNGEPLGVRNADCAIGVAADSANTFAIEDASEMVSKLKLWGGRASWAMHRSSIPDLHALEVGTGGAVWLANLTNGGSAPLLDYPIDYTEHLPQADSSGHVILADWSAYGLFEFGPLTVDFSEHALFTSGQNVWRFDQELDGKPLFKSTIKDASGYTTSPFIVFTD